MIQVFQNSVKKLIMFCLISSPDLQSWYLSIISAIFLQVKARIFCRKSSITWHLFQPQRRNRKLTITAKKMRNFPKLLLSRDVLFSDFRLNYHILDNNK